MDATFEDFIDLAASRLERAALAVTDGATIGAATCSALSAATRSLITLSTRYGTAPNAQPATAWQPAFTDLLATADRAFRNHTRGSATPTSADEQIHDAAQFVTIAQDLLATHLTVPDPPRQFARTPAGTELLEIPVREHLLRRAAELADRLAALTRTAAEFDDLLRERPHLADAYRLRTRGLADAARALGDAAACCSEPTTASLHFTPAPVLAAAIAYPRPHEDPATAAAEIRVGLDRLATAAYQAANPLRTAEHPPAHTAGDLRASATSLAVAHALAADLLTRLAPYVPPSPGLNPTTAVDQLRAAGAAWAALHRPWQQTASVPDGGPRSPLTVQAHSAAIRFGRLLYTAPAWTPHDGPGQPRPLDELLAPPALDAICVALSALPRSAATIAAHHARLVTAGIIDLYSANRSHRPEDEGRRFYPLQPAQCAELRDGYQAATHASRTAATSLSTLNRGYQALKALALTRSYRPATSPTRSQAHRTRQTPQQPTTDRPISPKL